MTGQEGQVSIQRGLTSLSRELGEWAAGGFIAVIAIAADLTGIYFLLFPELGALAFDILKRPQGVWARAPVMLVITPCLTAIAGTAITRHLAYGPGTVLLTISIAMLIIRVLRSPIAPAISAGLLPLTLGVTDWRYPPAILFGTGLLACVATARARINKKAAGLLDADDQRDDRLEANPASYRWVPLYMAFLGIALAMAWLTGWRYVLFPPLVVIGFEMFAHADVCPRAWRPLHMPVACTLNACGGLGCLYVFGHGVVAAAASTIAGIAVLRLFRLHVPPAVAIGLLPLVMPDPGLTFPLAVALGTGLLTACFLAWRDLIMQGH